MANNGYNNYGTNQQPQSPWGQQQNPWEQQPAPWDQPPQPNGWEQPPMDSMYRQPARENSPQPRAGKQSSLKLLLIILSSVLGVLLIVLVIIILFLAGMIGGDRDAGETVSQVITENADAGQENTETGAGTAAAEAAPTPEPTPTPVPDDLVTDAYTEEAASVHIPKINMDGDAVERLNEEIYDSRYALVNTCRYLTYRWYVNGDILSLVCEYENINIDGAEYTIYNVSLSDGRQLSADDIIAALGCSEQEYLSAVEDAVSDKVLELYNRGGMGAGYDYQMSSSTAESNLRDAVPYLGENGQLCVKALVWGFVGAECYEYDLATGLAAKAESGTEPAADGENADADELFSILAGKEMYYASGAGGWGETLTVNADGSFYGSTADSDLGLSIQWMCDFTGTFDDVTKISDYEYTVRVAALDAPEFDDYTDGGITCSYTAPYGISQGMTFHVYLPGMKVSELPEEYTSIACVSSALADGQEEFPCCGMYSPSGGCYCE